MSVMNEGGERGHRRTDKKAERREKHVIEKRGEGGVELAGCRGGGEGRGGDEEERDRQRGEVEVERQCVIIVVAERSGRGVEGRRSVRGGEEVGE